MNFSYSVEKPEKYFSAIQNVEVLKVSMSANFSKYPVTFKQTHLQTLLFPNHPGTTFTKVFCFIKLLKCLPTIPSFQHQPGEDLGARTLTRCLRLMATKPPGANDSSSQILQLWKGGISRLQNTEQTERHQSFPNRFPIKHQGIGLHSRQPTPHIILFILSPCKLCTRLLLSWCLWCCQSQTAACCRNTLFLSSL